MKNILNMMPVTHIKSRSWSQAPSQSNTISNIIIIENKITNMTKIKIKNSTKLKIAIINTNTTIVTVMMMIGRTEMNIYR